MKNNWMTCWACAYFPYSMLLPPIPGAAPTWPLVSIAVVAYPYLRLSAPPPSLITDVSYDPRLLRIVAPTAVHVRGYLSAWENLWVTPAEFSNCVVLLGPNLVNAAAEAVSLDPVCLLHPCRRSILQLIPRSRWQASGSLPFVQSINFVPWSPKP